MTELKSAEECYGEIVSAYQAGEPLMSIIRDFQRNALAAARDAQCGDCGDGYYEHAPCFAMGVLGLLATLEPDHVPTTIAEEVDDGER